MPSKKDKFDDKQILSDALTSQNFITGNYNLSVNECVDNAVKNEFMNILSEEHQIQGEIFAEMSKRGWYPTQKAEAENIMKSKQKFTDILNNM